VHAVHGRRISPFALAFSQFILPDFKESNLSALYFPFTGDHYKEIIFEMTEGTGFAVSEYF